MGREIPDEQGRLLLDRNPLRGLRTPTEKNPTRVVLTEQEYRALLKVSRRVDWRFHVALVHETGHRIGSIRQLRWCDIDFEGGAILWRAKHDKSGYEHITPVTAEALDALKEVWSANALAGEAPVLPAPRNPLACLGAGRLHAWWNKAQILAGLKPMPGRGWHSLRRKFASDLMDQPLKVLCQLGGWKTAKTVLRCYQQAYEGQLRKALEDRRRTRDGNSRIAGVKWRESGLSNTQMHLPQEDAKLQPHAGPAPHHSRCSRGFVHGLPGLRA